MKHTPPYGSLDLHLRGIVVDIWERNLLKDKMINSSGRGAQTPNDLLTEIVQVKTRKASEDPARRIEPRPTILGVSECPQ